MDRTSKKLPKGLIQKIRKALPYTSLMERVLLILLGILITITTIVMLWRINERFLVTVPAHGGVLTEGIIGTPRFINPVLALTEADKDLTSLIYSGLLKITPEGLEPDLAERFTISEDGTLYTFYIRDDAVFHDGEKVTSEDVLYTIEMINDPLVKSPRESSWNDVLVSIVDEKTVQFILNEPFTPFIENLTIGILPEHVWNDLSPEQFSLSRNNIEPVGSGPYKISIIREDKSGIPTEYTLSSFKDHVSGEPFISEIITKFYTSEEKLLEAKEKQEIDSAHGISPALLSKEDTEKLRIETVTLPRIFGVFFNQGKNSIFTNDEVREALSVAIDRQVLIERILQGFGVPLNGPTPDDIEIERTENSIAKAQEILEENEWEQNEDGIYENEDEILRFTLTTTDIPELKQAAELMRDTWRLVGIEVEVEIFDPTALNQNVIRPREYEALLFGEVIGRSRDLYPFWHSSGRNDPGLNIALYTNSKVDKLLETMRTTTNGEEWLTSYNDIREEIILDVPAVFLYAPHLIYILPEKIENFSFPDISLASERFATISTWYIHTQRVWGIFAD